MVSPRFSPATITDASALSAPMPRLCVTDTLVVCVTWRFSVPLLPTVGQYQSLRWTRCMGALFLAGFVGRVAAVLLLLAQQRKLERKQAAVTSHSSPLRTATHLNRWMRRVVHCVWGITSDMEPLATARLSSSTTTRQLVDSGGDGRAGAISRESL